MSLNSKLDLRLEAAKLVCQLPETTIDNFHERAYRVELYLTGDAELPEQDDSLGELKKMIQEAKDLAVEYYSMLPCSLHRSDSGSPVSLQQDGEKVE